MPIQVLMPALSPTMTEGTVARWLKKEGERVRAGELIAEIETDKATMEVESVDEGILGRILVPAGTGGVKVNTPIALLLEEGESAAALTSPVSAPAPTLTPAPAPAAQTASPVTPVTTAPPAPQAAHGTGARIFATPLARRLAAEKGIALATLQGSGPHGRIVKADVLKGSPATALASAPTAAPLAAGDAADLIRKLGQPFTALPNNAIKKVTARRLSESKQTIPHFYLTVDCRIDCLLNVRKRLNADCQHKVSVNDFIIRAIALALRDVPGANAAWSDDAVLQFTDVDVSVAVATPNGLITPIVKKADTKGLSAIAGEMKDLAERARLGKLKPEEFMGGGFTLSNLGMFGIKQFSAIINPPQSCILAVGAGEPTVVVSDGKMEIATVMTCTLSVDHRSVDGAVGAQFLAAFKKRIEDPALMLL